MSVSSPIVSVVIPTYNCGPYINQAVESVLAQENCRYELIVIDDGSTDETKAQLQIFGDRLLYIYQDNAGVSKARNHGLSQATGKYVVFLDADDLFLPNRLAAQVTVFEQGLQLDDQLGIVHSGWVRVDANNQVLKEIYPWEATPTLTLESWLKYKPVLPSAMMFRKDWLDHVNGFNPDLSAAEDVDLSVRLALEGCTACWLKDVTTGYRQHGNSAMGRGINQAIALNHVMDTVFAHPRLPKDIQLMEHQIRYGTLVWLAWYLHHTNRPQEMAYYLDQSRQYAPYARTTLITHWIQSFCEYSQQWGTPLNTPDLVASPEWQHIVKSLLYS